MGLFNFKKQEPKPQPTLTVCGITTPYNIEAITQQILDALQPAPNYIPSFALGAISKLEVIKVIDGTSRTKHAHMLKIDTGDNTFDAYVDAQGNVIKADWYAYPAGNNSINYVVLLDTYRSDSLYIKELGIRFNK